MRRSVTALGCMHYGEEKLAAALIIGVITMTSYMVLLGELGP